MDYVISVDNIKCGGCAATIDKTLKALPGVHAVTVDIAAQTVTVTGDGGSEAACATALEKLGYPLRGAGNGLLTKAKSVVSCAIGRVSA